MVVDDTMFMRTQLKSILSRNGFEVVGEAKDGLDALKVIGMCDPDIITMDITMPNMDGIQAVKEIRKLRPNVKICMVTAIGQENFVREAIMSGAKSYVIKPFKEEHVISTLKKIAE